MRKHRNGFHFIIEGDSLLLFGPNNKVRIFFANLIRTSYFE